jgi:hypothetical protein
LIFLHLWFLTFVFCTLNLANISDLYLMKYIQTFREYSSMKITIYIYISSTWCYPYWTSNICMNIVKNPFYFMYGCLELHLILFSNNTMPTEIKFVCFDTLQ